MSVVIQGLVPGVTYYFNAEPAGWAGTAWQADCLVKSHIRCHRRVRWFQRKPPRVVPESGANGLKSEFLYLDRHGTDSGFMEDRAVHGLGALVAVLLWRGRFGEFDLSRDEPGEAIFSGCRKIERLKANGFNPKQLRKNSESRNRMKRGDVLKCGIDEAVSSRGRMKGLNLYDEAESFRVYVPETGF